MGRNCVRGSERGNPPLVAGKLADDLRDRLFMVGTPATEQVLRSELDLKNWKNELFDVLVFEEAVERGPSAKMLLKYFDIFLNT